MKRLQVQTYKTEVAAARYAAEIVAKFRAPEHALKAWPAIYSAGFQTLYGVRVQKGKWELGWAGKRPKGYGGMAVL